MAGGRFQRRGWSCDGGCDSHKELWEVEGRDCHDASRSLGRCESRRPCAFFVFDSRRSPSLTSHLRVNVILRPLRRPHSPNTGAGATPYLISCDTGSVALSAYASIPVCFPELSTSIPASLRHIVVIHTAAVSGHLEEKEAHTVVECSCWRKASVFTVPAVQTQSARGTARRDYS